MVHQELWNALRTMNPAEVCRCSLACFDRGKGSYLLKILNRDYQILPESSVIQGVDSSAPHSPGFYLQVAVLNYLIYAKDIPLSGNWVNEKQFPTGAIFFRGPHEMPAKKLEQIFSQNSEGFCFASHSCGGTKVDGGDVAFEFPVFPRIPVRLILWMADEEFSARVSYLFDRTANIHLQLDALYAVGKVVEAALLEAAVHPKS